MAGQITQQFIDALHRLEDDRDHDTIASLFDDNAELMNVARETQPHGRDGAEAFWDDYRSVFDRIHSEFTSIKEGDNFAVLEWHAGGTLANGAPIEYDGVSVLEFASDHISRFATYFDSRAFARTHPA
ncbi:MAG: nuclear transport factor 2 family protein [Phycisphaeraceae bacterium]